MMSTEAVGKQEFCACKSEENRVSLGPCRSCGLQSPPMSPSLQKKEDKKAEVKPRTEFPSMTPAPEPNILISKVCQCSNKGRQHQEPIFVGEVHTCETCGQLCDCNPQVKDIADVFEKGSSSCQICGELCHCPPGTRGVAVGAVQPVAIITPIETITPSVCNCKNKGRQHLEPILVGEKHKCETCGKDCNCMG